MELSTMSRVIQVYGSSGIGLPASSVKGLLGKSGVFSAKSTGDVINRHPQRKSKASIPGTFRNKVKSMALHTPTYNLKS